jgi:hypothetical protein
MPLTRLFSLSKQLRVLEVTTFFLSVCSTRSACYWTNTPRRGPIYGTALLGIQNRLHKMLCRLSTRLSVYHHLNCQFCVRTIPRLETSSSTPYFLFFLCTPSCVTKRIEAHDREWFRISAADTLCPHFAALKRDRTFFLTLTLSTAIT